MKKYLTKWYFFIANYDSVSRGQFYPKSNFQLYGDNIKRNLFRVSRILPAYPKYIFYEV